MAIKRMPIGLFMTELRAACARNDGYIMGAKGQEPKKLSNWFFNQYKDREQYTAKQEAKALYWRENAERVWDCNGLAEGIYEMWSGVNINTRARYNYSGWCGQKGTGMIPVMKRVPGAPVFWGKKASSIHHVAYLDRPVVEGKADGDWYIIEARGVMYGVVRTKLSERLPNFWGIMDKYFDYGDVDYLPTEPELGERILRNGMTGGDVKELQESLISLGYDCGSWGADGEYGDHTEIAVRNFQTDHGCKADGEYGPITHAAMLKALEAAKNATATAKRVQIIGGNCWIRSEPNTGGEKLGVAVKNSVHEYAGKTASNGWLKIDKGWVSGKYGKLVK